MAAKLHQFFAVAFEENFSLRQLNSLFPNARTTPHELSIQLDSNGAMYLYPFGAVAMFDVPVERRKAELDRLHKLIPRLTTKIVQEEYAVAEDASVPIGISDGVLRLDRVTAPRAGIVALTVAQSAAMEYYENLVDSLFVRTRGFVDALERRGTVPFRVRPLHRFIGEAITTRNEVLSVLHLLDKPDAVWEDAAIDRIYNDLRAEFDLSDRYSALESKLRSIQETLELLVQVARDRSLILLEVAIVLLILFEVVANLSRLF